jgi:hypothetical protein
MQVLVPLAVSFSDRRFAGDIGNFRRPEKKTITQF